MVTSLGRPIVTVAPEPEVSISLAVPAIVNACPDGVAALPSVETDFTTASLRVTAPEVTPKSSLPKDAIPLAEVVASLIENVTPAPDAAISTGLVPVNVNVAPVETLAVPVSPEISTVLAGLLLSTYALIDC